jgi:uncharacterized membrane protein YozB (DUF420 family)
MQYRNSSKNLGLWGKIGIFNASAPFLSDLSLILQAIIFFVLALAVYARLKHSYVKHATLMGVGIVLHTISIFMTMVPSLLSMADPSSHLLVNLLTGFSLLVIIHATLGSLVEITGIWLVATWLPNRAGVEKCFKRKNVMRVTAALWLLELILGIYIYKMLYLAA